MKSHFILLALIFCGCSTTNLTHGIPNLAIVEPGIYRGGEPTPEGWKYLQSLGVCKTLRLDYDNEKPKGVSVPDGILDVQEAMPPSEIEDIFKSPSRKDLILRSGWIAAQIGQPPSTGAKMEKICPVFVHCLHGQDRTGIVIAYYRVIFCHWTKAQAEQEMLSHGFHKSLVGLWRAWEEWQPNG